MSYYNRKLERITADEYSRLASDPNYVVVAIDREGTLRVSTIWLGMDHDHFGAGVPLVFETCVFDDDEDRTHALLDGAYRWIHEDEAVDGHARICREWLEREPEAAS